MTRHNLPKKNAITEGIQTGGQTVDREWTDSMTHFLIHSCDHHFLVLLYIEDLAQFVLSYDFVSFFFCLTFQ